MAGGNWTAQDKLRPGAYINFETGAIEEIDLTGNLVTMPLELDFGPEQEVVPVTRNNITQFGRSLDHKSSLLVREALKRVDVVLIYRLNKGEAAKATQDNFSVTANYTGNLGNEISIVSKANVDEPTQFYVETYVSGKIVDTQVGGTIGDLSANAYVTFSGTGELKAFNVTLTGGTNGSTTVDNYADYFKALEVYEFAYMALPITQTTIISAAVSYIKRLRDEEGKKCQLVVAGNAANHEAVINVKNGVVLSDESTITPAQATAWVAAASASIGLGKSLTQQAYDGAIDVYPRLTSSEIESSIRAGEFLFTPIRGEARVEIDINSLISFTDKKSKVWAKNEVVRTFDHIANDTRKVFEDNYIGKVHNDSDGREAFRANRILAFQELVGLGAIQNFDMDSVQVAAGDQPESMVMIADVTVLNTLEKLYETVSVK